MISDAISMPEAVRHLIDTPGLVVQNTTTKTFYKFDGDDFHRRHEWSDQWQIIDVTCSLFAPNSQWVIVNGS